MNIEDYIPHRGAARMIDRVIAVDEEHVVTEADVPVTGRMVRSGAMPTWVGIELMAQSIAAWAGERAHRSGRPTPLGFLLGTRRFEMTCNEVSAGTTLRIEAHCEFIADSGLGTFRCQMLVGEKLIAHAQVSVFEPSDAPAYLRGAAP
jgi:predicted hotdog family 3-hydroxylacyl-ACP dehydratase